MKDLDKYDDQLNHKEQSPGDDEMSQFLHQSAQAGIPSGRGKQAIWESIEAALDEEEIAQEETSKKVVKINPWIAGGIAAAVLLLMVFVLTFQSVSTPEKVHIIAEADSDLTHVLHDGSTVSLNGSSSIFYDDDWDRSLSLAGEAFFEVTKGSTFKVKTPYGEVEVLGTSFNVFARDSIFEVACKTGSVHVSIPEKSIERDLKPGDKLAARMDTVFQTSLQLEEIANWTTGEFYFSNRPIREVMDEIERQYATTIDIKNGDTLRFTGYFFSDADINSTLDLICLPLGLKFEKKDDVYIVSELSQEL